MKIPRVCFRITAYQSVVASPGPRMRCHGAGGASALDAIPASMSWRCVAT